MPKEDKSKGTPKVIYRQEVYDRKHNFLGYVEDMGDGTFNHYDQDDVYLGTTMTKRFDYRKAKSQRND